MAGQQAIGVFLSRGEVRVALLESTSEGVQALALREAPLAARVMDESGVVRTPENVAEAVREALAGSPAQTTNVRLALGGDGLVLRNMAFPPMPAGDMREAIRAEIEHYSLFSLGEEVIGYQLGQPEGEAEEGSMSVVVTATHRHLAESADAVLAAMGADAAACELAILAGARALLHAGELSAAAEGYAMLLLLGSWGTEAIIAGDGQLLFSHVLDLRIRNVLRAADEAASGGFLEQSPDQAQDLGPVEPAAVVATEAGRCVRFFQRERPDSSQVRLALTMSDVLLTDEFHEQLGQRLGMPTRAANPLAGIEIVDPRWLGAVQERAVSSYAPAIGAALAGLGMEADAFWAPLSVRAMEVRRQPGRPLLPVVLPGGMLLMVFLALGGTFKLEGSLAHRKAASIESQIQAAARQTQATESITPDQKQAILAGIERARPTLEPKAAKQWAPVLDQVVARLPQGTSLQSLEIDANGNALIKGTAPHESGTAKLVEALRLAPCFTGVRLSSLEAVRESGTAVGFEVVAQVR